MSANLPPDKPKTFDEDAAKKMGRIAREVFAPIYPVLANQIIDRLGFTSGWCLDIGAGPGSLGLALARQTKLKLILLDSSGPMIRAARENLTSNGLGHRCLITGGDVQALPLADSCLELIISRGSIFFWENLELAFGEIYRVLAPSGRTFLGGGFGTAELRERIAAEMARRDPGWLSFRERNLGRKNKDRIITALNLKAVSYDLIDDDSGFWIIIKKEPAL